VTGFSGRHKFLALSQDQEMKWEFLPATILHLMKTIICNQAEQSIVLTVERKLQESRSLYLVRINPIPR
jgi:hypothetical protein